MRCPYCGQGESKVLETRLVDDGFSIRRRRECMACQSRFTTYEKRDDIPLLVIKKDGWSLKNESPIVRVAPSAAAIRNRPEGTVKKQTSIGKRIRQ
jgi:transcriptional regulator NrdR family protein